MTAAGGAEDVLAALPPDLRGSLLAAARQAADLLGRSGLPTGLRPYAGFTPAALGEGTAFTALNQALASDARLREAVGKTLPARLWKAAAAAPPTDLIERFGASEAAAALVARARWDDVAAVASASARPVRAPQPVPAATDGAKKADISAARRERAQAQRRADAAEQRAAQAEAQLREVRQALADAELLRARMEREHDAEQRRWRDRLARLQRRTSEAEARARAQHNRATQLARDLRGLADRLLAEERSNADPGEQGLPTPGDGAAAKTAVPRGARAASPGRPCVLPPGIAPDMPDAALALLAVPDIAVVVDGYNVTKDLRGVPSADLPQQRAWLEALLAGVAAPRRLRITVVYDGDGERAQTAASARVVRVIYTPADEIADDRIVAIVEGLPDSAPALVVSSDADLRERSEALGANVVGSGVFLKAVG